MNPRLSLFSVISSLWHKFKKRRKIQVIGALCLILISGLFEMISLGLVVPFLTVLIDPKLLFENSFTASIVNFFKLDQISNLRLIFTISFALSSLLANSIRLLNIWVITYLSQKIGNDLSSEALKRTLSQPYSVHINRNSNIVLAGLTHHVLQTIVAINFSLQLVAAVIILIFLILTLVAFEPSLALFSIFIFTLSYLLIGLKLKKRLSRNSKDITDMNNKILKILQESLGSIRDIIINNKIKYFIKAHNKYDQNLRLLNAENIFLTSIPRYAMEAIGICFISLFSYLAIKNSATTTNIVPLLGILALSAQRILPALYLVFKGWSALQIAKDSVLKLLDLLNQPIPMLQKERFKNKIIFKEHIKFNNVFFKYHRNGEIILNNINLVIKKGSRVGIVGETGSGKSTTVDLLMGLLKPSSGSILIDNKELHNKNNEEFLNQWRNSIAHVPQEIYISDSSFAENIAFGIDFDLIDIERMKESAKLARISEYIESTPLKYKTLLGERGTKLSGGQLQRIGIARSLYLGRNILVFDEATSSLDKLTEEKIMDSLKSLSQEITIIMISHRNSSLKQCDLILSVKNGSIEKTNL
tara:strand:- start:849 stop:2609 length:1761 start_codon:yes stop_codon:yes gene_type:complete